MASAPPVLFGSSGNLRRDTPAPIGPRVFKAPAQCCGQAHDRPDPAGRRRARLGELNAHLHCSVIGTCLSTAELRRLVSRFAAVARDAASDLDVHHTAVQLAGENGAAAKALHKLLDERYAGAVRRFGLVRDERALLEAWQESLAQGDVPGAYWALLTHPDVTPDLRQQVFGEVHMLSHLVGASNRADIRRLRALEVENDELKDKVARQQQRLQQASLTQDAMVRDLQERLAQASHAALAPSADAAATGSESLRAELADHEARLATQQQRHDTLLQRLHEQVAQTRLLQSMLDDSCALLTQARGEIGTLEQALVDQASTPEDPARFDSVLRDRKVVYVGGRPASSQAIRTLVESSCGRITLHDGGLEDRKGLLASALAGADLVAFPVDCIDHDSMNALKRQCDRLGITWHPLRSASLASFVALLARLTRSSRLHGTADSAAQ